MKSTRFQSIRILGLFLMLPSFLMAQELSDLSNTETTELKKRPVFESGLGLGLNIGTDGIFGIDVVYGISENLNVRAGYNHNAFSYANETTPEQFGFTDEAFEYETEFDLNTIELGVDLTPIPGQRWLRLSGGVQFALSKSAVATLAFKEPQQFNDLVLTPEELGTFTISYTNQNDVMPYVTLGFGPTLPWKKFAVNFDVGGLYRGKPQITTVGTGLIEDNAELGEVLTVNAEGDLKWHPILALRLAYRLN